MGQREHVPPTPGPCRTARSCAKATPIGVLRSDRQYENFILSLEWKHLTAGGNSGVFVWSEGTVPEGKQLPKGMEVQILELDWAVQHKLTDAYVHGEVFPTGGITTVPDNPRGPRSKSAENRCKGKGEWNSYTIVAVDGAIKLSVNGKFVNGISKASVEEGLHLLGVRRRSDPLPQHPDHRTAAGHHDPRAERTGSCRQAAGIQHHPHEIERGDEDDEASGFHDATQSAGRRCGDGRHAHDTLAQTSGGKGPGRQRTPKSRSASKLRSQRKPSRHPASLAGF